MSIASYWKIILEIAILWYVIYLMLLLIKGTRTEQLLKGLFIVGIIFVISQQLNLETINWAITRLFPISIIALVIIFQPELRRGLAQLGQFGIHQENIEAIDEIADAAVELSNKRKGAIIVMERETGLKSYLESGTIIDGEVTSLLLTAIFISQSPLHDGAVIIRRGRVAAAGCVLPLPGEDRMIPKSYGMRHRAAIGISEETDAVSIVISEETGAISVALGGNISSRFDRDALVGMLKDIFYKRGNNDQFYKKIFFKKHRA